MRLFFALAAAAVLAGAAHAQQAGVYQGTTGDGRAIAVAVADNPSSGHFEIVSASVSYPTCAAGAPVATRIWSPNVDITAPRQKFSFYNGYAMIDMSIVFDGTNAARGTVIARQAYGTRFNGGGPRHVGICRRPWQHYTLSYAGP